MSILSCGCKSDYEGFPSEWKGWTREDTPCTFYGSLCEKHYSEYEAIPNCYDDNLDILSKRGIVYE